MTNQDKFLHERAYRGDDYTNYLKKLITICGVGAIGSNLVDSLTRIGFSNIRIIDKDRVEEKNISTQVYDEKDIGALKCDALKNKVFRNVGVEIEAVNKELTASNAKSLLKQSNLVIDTFDNSASRQLIQTECRTRKLNCLHSGLFSSYGEIVWDKYYRVPKDSTEDVCDYPLARNIILLTVAVLTEEILDYCLNSNPRESNWSITLKDLTIRQMPLTIFTN